MIPCGRKQFEDGNVCYTVPESSWAAELQKPPGSYLCWRWNRTNLRRHGRRSVQYQLRGPTQAPCAHGRERTERRQDQDGDGRLKRGPTWGERTDSSLQEAVWDASLLFLNWSILGQLRQGLTLKSVWNWGTVHIRDLKCALIFRKSLWRTTRVGGLRENPVVLKDLKERRKAWTAELVSSSPRF